MTVAQVKEAHSAYVADRQTYYVIALKKQGKSDAEATATASAAVTALNTYGGTLEGVKAARDSLVKQKEEYEAELAALKTAGADDNDPNVVALTQGIAQLETGIASLNGVIALEEAYQTKESMSFQTFCEKVLGQSAATAKQMNDLWLVYASGKVKGGDTPASGGTLSGELLHNDSEDSSEKNTSGGDSASSGDHSDGSSEKTPGGSGSESTDGTVEGSSTDTGNGSETGDSGAQNPPDSSNTDENGSANTGSGENNGENNGGGSPKDPTDAPNPPDPENPGTETKPNAPLPPSESVGGAVVDLISGGLDSAMAEIAKLQKSLAGVMNRLKDPTSQVISDLSALCGRIENLSSLLNSAEDLSAAIRHSSADLRDILDNVEDLQDILDDYEPVLQDTLKTVSSLSTSAIKTIRDTQGLISDTEALMKSTGATLDDGTKQTLEGLAAVLRSTAKTMGTAGQIKDAKTSICDIIEDTWDEYTGDVNNLLLMDATAEAVSLTDSRNPSPESIQILTQSQSSSTVIYSREDTRFFTRSFSTASEISSLTRLESFTFLMHSFGVDLSTVSQVMVPSPNSLCKNAVLIDIAKQIDNGLFVSDCKLIAACKNAVLLCHFLCRLFGAHAVAAGDKHRIAFGSKTVRTRKSCSDGAAGHKHSFFHK